MQESIRESVQKAVHPEDINLKNEDKICKIGMFATPKSMMDLQNWIESFPSQDKAMLYTAAFMAWNLACEAVYGKTNNEVGEDNE